MQPVVRNGRFVNPAFADAPAQGARFSDFLKWRRERKPAKPPFDVPRADAPTQLDAPSGRGVAATWVGHSSVVLRLDGATFLCDPVWSDRVGGVVKRHTEPGVAWRALPPVDALMVSHNHFDHLDAPTVKRLPRGTRVLCPLGVGAWFRAKGFTRVSELAWWQSAQVGEHAVTLVPAQHFSGRTLWDRDRSLWGGFVVQGPHGSSAYFAGDSGYFDGFRQIGEAFAGLDLVMMPIGAYEPRWFMSSVHTDPAEGARAFLDTGGGVMLPIHWGAFLLADEGIDVPPRELRAWWEKEGLPAEPLAVPALGETVRV